MKNRPDVGTDYTAFSLDMNDASRKLYVSKRCVLIQPFKAREYVSGGEENKKAKPQSLRITNTGERFDCVK